MEITQSEIENVKSRLIYGDIKLIASKSDRSERHVQKVFNGEATDLDVIEVAMKVISQRKKKSNKVKKRMNRI
jgi:hypothetical protein